MVRPAIQRMHGGSPFLHSWDQLGLDLQAEPERHRNPASRRGSRFPAWGVSGSSRGAMHVHTWCRRQNLPYAFACLGQRVPNMAPVRNACQGQRVPNMAPVQTPELTMHLHAWGNVSPTWHQCRRQNLPCICMPRATCPQHGTSAKRMPGAPPLNGSLCSAVKQLCSCLGDTLHVQCAYGSLPRAFHPLRTIGPPSWQVPLVITPLRSCPHAVDVPGDQVIPTPVVTAPGLHCPWHLRPSSGSRAGKATAAGGRAGDCKS